MCSCAGWAGPEKRVRHHNLAEPDPFSGLPAFACVNYNPAMADTVALTFSFVSEDFVSASRWVVMRSPRTYVIAGLIGLLFLLVGGLIWWWYDQAMGQSIMLASVGAALFVLPVMWVGVAAHARKVFDANTAFKHDFHWLLSPTELQINGKGLSATLELTHFHRVAESPDGIVLWQTPGVFNYLPKRALPDQATLERIRTILRQGLPGTARIQLRDD